MNNRVRKVCKQLLLLCKLLCGCLPEIRNTGCKVEARFVSVYDFVVFVFLNRVILFHDVYFKTKRLNQKP